MADEYIVVNSGQGVYFFDEKTFYDFINEVGRSDRSKIGYIFLDKFPLPTPETQIDSHPDKKRLFTGRFCPFGNAKSWPNNALFVLKNGSVFVPEKREVTKVVLEYGLPNTDAAPGTRGVKLEITKVPKKAPAKKSRK